MARRTPASLSHHGIISSSLHLALLQIGGVLMGLCATVLVVSLCATCWRRRTTRITGDNIGGETSPDQKKQQQKAPPPPPQQQQLKMEGEDYSGVNIKQPPGTPQRSPVWQRAILMGERCQRPTFSGLVLYDEKGNPLPRERTHPPHITLNTAA